MNPHLEIILNFIQQSKEWGDDAKANILKAVQEANGELEEKNRALEIEVGLEGVRSRAMAMLNSSDLTATASTVFVELRKLGIHPIRTGVTLLTTDSHAGMFYSGTSTKGIDELALVGSLDMTAHPVLKKQYEAWLKKENYFPDLNEEEQESYYAALLAQPAVPIIREEIPRGRYGYYFPFREGLFYAWTLSPFSESEIGIIGRFKCIIELTFRRYLDLQKAEAQAREAKIEAALERVRAKAMAMHSSEDLAETLSVFYHELKSLNVTPRRCGVALIDKETRIAELTTMNTTEQGNSIEVIGHFKMVGHPILDAVFENWLVQKEYHAVLRGNEINEYYQVLKSQISYPEYLHDDVQYGYYFMFKEGDVYAWTEKELSEDELKIYRRFTTVIHLTYKRYKDLQQAEAQAKEAQLERQRSEDLLLNILPREIATELIQFGKSYARKHKEVTVLFADIKDFSSIAEILSPDELVTQLDECFRAFDKIVEKHGLEKIKTVGDAYVCACGLPQPVANHAAKTVAAALDMLEFINGFGITKKIQNLPAFEFRVGIHTGPVVTGVVGLKKFTYDIWGDAVNMAARMEQHGEAGKINVSGNTYQLIKDKFSCTHRGKIQAKNKGEVDMYFVDIVSQK